MTLSLIQRTVAKARHFFSDLTNRDREVGSPTNASDAVDDITLKPNPTHDELIDAGVKESFPASDPLSVNPSETAYEKEQRRKKKS
jgi:hypothetical protein